MNRRLLWPILILLLMTGPPREEATAQTSGGGVVPAVTARVDHTDLAKLHWQLACRADTFRQMSCFAMIDLLHSLNIHHIELAGGQSLSPNRPDVKVGPSMAPAEVDALTAKLKSVHMDVVSYDAGTLSSDEAEARKTFALGKALTVKNIIAQAAGETLPLLDKLANQYSINVALLNAPTRDSTEALLRSLQGRSGRLGICADLAAWQRAGLTPVAGLEKFHGHVTEVRLRNINDRNQEVPLDAGATDTEEALTWLKAHNFAGVFSIGYPSGGGQELVNHWVTSVNAFSDMVAKVAAGSGS